jgi:DNA-binding SARP family transcriptional activator/predicted ATPase
MPSLAIHLFGYPRVLNDGSAVKLERRKSLALFAYLAVESKSRAVSREQIADLFWPEHFQDQAGAYLRQALWDITRAVGEGWVVRAEQTLSLRGDSDLEIDVNAYAGGLARWKAGQARGAEAIPLLSELAACYQGDFMAGFTLRDCPAFDEWQLYQAESLRLSLGQVLENLVEARAAALQWDLAVADARRWLALDPLNETAHAVLMRLYAGQGQRAAALLQYETLTRVLADELGVEPGAETTALHEQIQNAQDTPPARSVEIGSAGSGAPRPVSLPAQLTTFIGREEELQRIAALLADPDCRLITLTGVGGSGKTRLAIQAAGASAGFPAGVYYAGLAAVASYEHLLSALAEALRLAFRNAPGSNLPLEEAKNQLLRHLSGRQILLVLDNFEQINFCADFLAEILDAAPGLKLIVTSRERLNLRAETVLEIGGLPLPEAFDTANQSAAVQLFLKSAARAGRFQPGLADWPAIVHICRLVEGIPLGLEMAAGWTRTVSCAEIAAEIERDLDFLQAGWREAPQRQSTFRAVFEHSWRLLSEKERAVFARLSIFRGDFTRTAALEVAGASLAALAGLIDKSMLRRLPSGRFEIHPLLRQYAAEKLAGLPEHFAETRRRFAAFFSAWLQEQYQQLQGAGQFAALAALRREIPELFAAWRILLEERDVARLSAGLPAAILFNVMNDHRIEMLEYRRLLLDMIAWLEPAAESGGPASAAVRELYAFTLIAYRHFALDHAQPQITRQYHTKSIALLGEMEDNYAKASALLLASIGPGALSPVDALVLTRQSQALYQQLGDTWGSALAQMIMADGLAFVLGVLEQARELYQSSLSTFTRLGNDWGRALCLNGLSFIASRGGRGAQAFELGCQSLELFERLDNQERTTAIRESLARIAAELGNRDAARQYHERNRDLALRRGDLDLADHFQEQIDLLV